MNEDVKVKFIDALLSGKYRQIRGQLRSEHGVCANGVLCELAILEGLDITHGSENYGYDADGLKTSMAPPMVVTKWADVNKDWVAGLMRLNDGNDYQAPLSFEDIAETIKNGGLPE